MSALMGLPRMGTYVVKEDIEKAPTYDHVCNITMAAVRLTFPEMKDVLFVNFLGYKGRGIAFDTIKALIFILKSLGNTLNTNMQ